MPLIECRDCGAKISDAAAACIQCGCPLVKSVAEQTPAAFGQTPIPTPPPAVSVSHSKFRCAYCQSDDVKVLPLVVADGTSKIDTRTLTVGVGYASGHIGVGGARSTTTGEQRTQLAKLVSKPQRERQRAGLAQVRESTVLFLVAILCVVAVAIAFQTFVVVYGGLPASAFLWAWKRIGETPAVSLVPIDTYPAILEQWQRSFLCMRCMRVIDPGELVSAVTVDP